MKLYYLFLLIMYFVLGGCTNETNRSTYSNKYEYSTKKDTTNAVTNKRRTYSTSRFYNSTSSPSYKKKSVSSSRKTYRARRHRR